MAEERANKGTRLLEPQGSKGETWDFDGEQLTMHWAFAVCYHVGFRGRRLVNAVALMCAESARYEKAWHKNFREDGTLHSIDRGLFQINDYWHPDLSFEDSYNAIENCRYAAKMSQNGRYFKAWMAYVSGAYEKFLPAAWATYALNVWRLRVPRVERRWGKKV